MNFGLTIEKILLIGVIAAVIIGPERLPAAAESLRAFLVQARRFAWSAQERVREELGPEVSDVDWQRLDPRRYDPRRIVREALLAEPAAVSVSERSPTPAARAADASEDEEVAPGADRYRPEPKAPQPRAD